MDEDGLELHSFSGGVAQTKTAGRWTTEEHSLFLQGLDKYEKQWKLIAELVKTRTVVQIRTHAQKYFQKKEKCSFNAAKEPSRKCTDSDLLTKKSFKPVCPRESAASAPNSTVISGKSFSADSPFLCVPSEKPMVRSVSGESSKCSSLSSDDGNGDVDAKNVYDIFAGYKTHLALDGSFVPNQKLLNQIRYKKRSRKSGVEDCDAESDKKRSSSTSRETASEQAVALRCERILLEENLDFSSDFMYEESGRHAFSVAGFPFHEDDFALAAAAAAASIEFARASDCSAVGGAAADGGSTGDLTARESCSQTSDEAVDLHLLSLIDKIDWSAQDGNEDESKIESISLDECEHAEEQAQVRGIVYGHASSNSLQPCVGRGSALLSIPPLVFPTEPSANSSCAKTIAVVPASTSGSDVKIEPAPALVQSAPSFGIRAPKGVHGTDTCATFPSSSSSLSLPLSIVPSSSSSSSCSMPPPLRALSIPSLYNNTHPSLLPSSMFASVPIVTPFMLDDRPDSFYSGSDPGSTDPCSSKSSSGPSYTRLDAVDSERKSGSGNSAPMVSIVTPRDGERSDVAALSAGAAVAAAATPRRSRGRPRKHPHPHPHRVAHCSILPSASADDAAATASPRKQQQQEERLYHHQKQLQPQYQQQQTQFASHSVTQIPFQPSAAAGDSPLSSTQEQDRGRSTGLHANSSLSTSSSSSFCQSTNGTPLSSLSHQPGAGRFPTTAAAEVTASESKSEGVELPLYLDALEDGSMKWDDPLDSSLLLEAFE